MASVPYVELVPGIGTTPSTPVKQRAAEYTPVNFRGATRDITNGSESRVMIEVHNPIKVALLQFST